MNEIFGFFHKMTGALWMPIINLLINKELNRINFIEKHSSELLYSDKSFFLKYGFFHFASPVNIWGNDFRLSIYFLGKGANVSDTCTGYGLRKFNYKETENEKIAARQFENFLVREIGLPEISSFDSTSRIWHTEWGIAYLGTTKQNGTDPEISIGWTTNSNEKITG